MSVYDFFRVGPPRPGPYYSLSFATPAPDVLVPAPFVERLAMTDSNWRRWLVQDTPLPTLYAFINSGDPRGFPCVCGEHLLAHTGNAWRCPFALGSYCSTAAGRLQDAGYHITVSADLQMQLRLTHYYNGLRPMMPLGRLDCEGNACMIGYAGYVQYLLDFWRAHNIKGPGTRYGMIGPLHNELIPGPCVRCGDDHMAHQRDPMRHDRVVRNPITQECLLIKRVRS